MEQRTLTRILEEEVKQFEQKIKIDVIDYSKPMFSALLSIMKSLKQQFKESNSVNPIKTAYMINNLDCLSNYRFLTMDDGNEFEVFMTSSQLGFFCFLIHNKQLYIYDMANAPIEYFSTTQRFVEIYHILITDIIQDILRTERELDDIMHSILESFDGKEYPIRINKTPSNYKPIMTLQLLVNENSNNYECSHVDTKENFCLFEIENIRKITSLETIIYTMTMSQESDEIS